VSAARRGMLTVPKGPGGKRKTHEELVEAEYRGFFAIHGNVDEYPREPFCVAHVGTGYRLAQTKNITAARRIIRAIRSLADWDFTDPATVKQWSKSRRLRIVRAVRRLGGTK
jgi:hypothetical protein